MKNFNSGTESDSAKSNTEELSKPTESESREKERDFHRTEAELKFGYSKAIDEKIRKFWDEINLAAFDPTRKDKKLYCLEMFSYPSAAKLHVGHWYNYALSDSWARFKKMCGAEIFQPMGFDAFGLPAENYAIKTGVHPAISTEDNIANMEEQLKAMGGIFNWDHEIVTCRPDYYRWNQWLFLNLYKRGLAYRKKAPVNWCPSCNTVLANEQVEADGTCERCHSEAKRRNLTQWFFKITAYAQELLDCLPALDWPEKTKKIQQNWIGRSEGAEIVFVAKKAGEILKDSEGKELELRVFTTRPDTLMGVTYLVVAPDADICNDLITEEQRAIVEEYQEVSAKKNEIERQAAGDDKTGVFTGSYAIHPLTGEELPVMTSDYVIAGYGTGCVMAVPAHDDRDYAFAVKYELPIKTVILPTDEEKAKELAKEAAELGRPVCYTERGVLTESGKFSGMSSIDGGKAIVGALADLDKGALKINYRLRDWLVSRQRYWGTPIPMIYCPDCGEVPVPEKDLPVKLPENVEFRPDGESPLKRCEEFVNCLCPKCGAAAQREADTLDTFVCSSWYQFRYVDNLNDEKPFSKEKVSMLCPVDKYIGGAEHAAMHLLYSRFITKALRDMGKLDFDEPFLSLVHQGVILGSDGSRMSKSKGNTITPDDYVEKYGADIVRLYLAFGFSFSMGGPWSDSGIQAIDRFVKRIAKLLESPKISLPKNDEERELTPELKGESGKELHYVKNLSLKEAYKDIDEFAFNTAVARLMEYLNALQKYEASDDCEGLALFAAVRDFLRALAPLAPHFAENSLRLLGFEKSVFLMPYPLHDPKALILEQVEVAVQVNGKIIGRIDVKTDSTAEEIEKMVRAGDFMPEKVAGLKIAKVIWVKNRLINLVVKP